MLVYFRVKIHRLYCFNCHCRDLEELHFLSSPRARITKALEQRIIEERRERSIRSVAEKYRLRWELVKDVEKRFLARKYARTPAAHVRRIGIDEIHIGRNPDRAYRFLTIVRDLQSGAVIHVGDGKGIAALEGLSKKLRKKKLKVVAMDMSNAYSSWVEKHFPKARIVFDHFHVIKLMNERLDKLRRRYIAQLDASQRDQFKKLRMLFLRNMENQDADSRLILSNIRRNFKELGDAYMFKEGLRSIYATAKNALEARAAFRRWATLATETGSKELIAMAKTIREKLSGIITYWTFDHLSNASTEGFNNKIRWLMRLAYGFHDISYLKLKIFQLPSIQPQKEI
ncbi:MAG: ISL3 family transposase [Synergistales bacterium]|nr:ISL3 family transposase [Synergistales bacterium]